MNPASADDSLGWSVHPPHAVRVAADRTRGLIAVQITDLSGGGSGVHWAKPPGGEHRWRLVRLPSGDTESLVLRTSPFGGLPERGAAGHLAAS